VEPAAKEFLKLSAANTWSCPFLNEKSNLCAIYERRPIECGLLKCWDTKKIKEIVYQDILSRWDLVPQDAEIRQIMETHERECAFKRLSAALTGNPRTINAEMQMISARDLAIREEAVTRFGLSIEAELFYFGRPMFKSFDFCNYSPHAT